MKIPPEPDLLLDPPELPEIPLPKGWSQYTLLTVLHVIAMARLIVLNVANWPDGGENSILRLRYENDRLKTPWPPNALPQTCPYSWHVMVVIDHFSRRIMGFKVFEQNPTAAQVASTMKRICTENAAKPKYLISDQGTQFVAGEFRAWCKSNDIRQRFGQSASMEASP